MKKLTAEKCRQLLDSLNSNGMSILEGYYVEALQIALPILEQQEQADRGWIEWRGGECPVRPNLIVETKWDDGDIITQPAGKPDWKHDSVVNIIAYRIIPEQTTNQNGEQ
jgi:hypothetical protein